MPNKSKQKEEAHLLNVKKAALFLGVSTSTIRKWALVEKLNGLKVGSRGDWRFTKEELSKMLWNGQKKYAGTNKSLKDHAQGIQKIHAKKSTKYLGKDTIRATYYKKHEENREAFLLELTDALRPLADSLEIQAEATRRLGTYLNVGRSFYCEVESDGDTMVITQDYINGVPSQVGRYSISSFGTFILEEVHAGRTIVVNNSATDMRMSESERLMHSNLSRAFVSVTLKKDGRLVSGLSVNQPTPRQWTQKEIQLVEDVAERTWAAVERAYAEEALVKSEVKYRTFFDSVDEGFSVVKVLFDKKGKPVDLLFLETNKAHDRLTRSPSSIIGMRIRELVPDIEEIVIERMGKIAFTGQPMRYEQYAKVLDGWLSFYSVRIGGVGSHIVANVFSDITGRKRREANLAFLAVVNADLVSLTNIDGAMNALGAKIGAHFRASICSFLEIDAERGIGTVIHDWHAKDAVSLVGEYKIADYGTKEQLATWRSGKPFVVRDTTSDKRVNGEALTQYGIGSYLSIPIARDGEWRYLLSIYDRVARDWRKEEIELMRELTACIWTRLERAHAETRIVKSEQKYRALLDSIDQGFYIAEVVQDATGTVVDFRHLEVNPALNTITGFGDITGKLVSEVAPQLETHWLEPFDRVVKTGEPVRVENYHEQTKKWYQVHYSSVGGVGSLLVGVVFDEITERKNREANLAFLAEVSQDLLQLTSIEAMMNKLGAKIGGYFQVSRCAFFEFNEALDGAKCEYDWHQAEDSSLIGSYRLSDFYTEEFLEIVRAGHTFVLRDSDTDPRVNADNVAAINVASYIIVPISINKQLRFALSVLDSKPRNWDDEKVELMREITNRIWTRLERAHTEELLQRASAQKDEFIAVAAHELKTPVTSVKAYAQVLEHRFRKVGDTTSADMLEKITVQVDKLNTLISDLLDVSKMESGRLEFKMEYFDIDLLTKEIVEEMQRTTDNHKFILSLEKNNLVFADRDRIGQVLINLLSNAIKYSHQVKEICISSRVEGENIIVSVHDDGSGIPEEHQQKIFERFHRVPGIANETYPGLGLGLYISSEIINRHNGSIWVQSEEHKGSTFYVSLPQAKKE